MGSCIPGKSKIQIKKLSFKTNKESIKNINENNSFNKINKNDNFFNENKQKFNSSNNNFLSAQPKIILVNNNKFIINTNVSNNTNDVSNENEQKIILMNNEFEDKKKLSTQNIINLKFNSDILNENHNNLIEQKTLKMKGPILNKLQKYSKKIKKKELN